jgi:hypothetical protein
MSVRRKMIGELAVDLLTKQHIEEAPVDVEEVAHALNIDVRKERVEGDISGFLFRNHENRVMVHLLVDA